MCRVRAGCGVLSLLYSPVRPQLLHELCSAMRSGLDMVSFDVSNAMYDLTIDEAMHNMHTCAHVQGYVRMHAHISLDAAL